MNTRLNTGVALAPFGPCGLYGGVSPAVPPTPFDLAASCAALAELDPALGAVAASLPPLEPRRCPPGVAGLVWMIIGQQVSTASARAVWDRLEAATGGVTSASLAALSDEAFRACGFSRQKTAYARALAQAELAGELDMAALARLDDLSALAALLRLKGVGRWTAEAYLMMGEGRGDLFPGGDIALQEAVRWLDGLPTRPDTAQTYARAEGWSPHRTAASHILWAWYVAVKAGELPHPITSPPLEEPA
ncbi:DNA-3-methyladenine glycosylase [soil metagenome]